MGADCPVCIPLCNSVCQASRCSSIMMFSMSSLARATCPGALAISNTSHKNCDRMESSWDLCPMIRRMEEEKKRKQRCRRRLLKSAPSQCERVWARACAFARLLLHSSPLWEGWSLGISLHQLLGDHVLMWVFWSFVPRREAPFLRNPVFFGVVSCVPSHLVQKTHRNTTIAWHRGTRTWCTFEARLWFQLRESPDDEAKENLLPEDSIKLTNLCQMSSGKSHGKSQPQPWLPGTPATIDPNTWTQASVPKRWAGERVQTCDFDQQVSRVDGTVSKNMFCCWRWIPIFFELASRFLEKTTLRLFDWCDR